ncbi:MAG: helix-turn-helix domain-containing protein [Rhodobacteraceae bacterium]|nr:MAG: helix-turn-helix domain-containing protein [Paracoccaceae bacterium]
MGHKVDDHVGQKIRHRRWLMGLTQQQLADAVGIKFQQIQKYETGMNRVSASRLWDIAQTLEVPPGYFFEGFEEDEGTSTASGDDLLSSKETLELLKTYYAIPEAQRKRLFELARALVQAA